MSGTNISCGFSLSFFWFGRALDGLSLVPFLGDGLQAPHTRSKPIGIWSRDSCVCFAHVAIDTSYDLLRLLFVSDLVAWIDNDLKLIPEREWQVVSLTASLVAFKTTNPR